MSLNFLEIISSPIHYFDNISRKHNFQSTYPLTKTKSFVAKLWHLQRRARWNKLCCALAVPSPTTDERLLEKDFQKSTWCSKHCCCASYRSFHYHKLTQYTHGKETRSPEISGRVCLVDCVLLWAGWSSTVNDHYPGMRTTDGDQSAGKQTPFTVHQSRHTWPKYPLKKAIFQITSAPLSSKVSSICHHSYTMRLHIELFLSQPWCGIPNTFLVCIHYNSLGFLKFS